MDVLPNRLFPPVDSFALSLSTHPRIHYKYMRPRLQSAYRLQTAFYRKMNNAFVLEEDRTFSLQILKSYL